jgi:subtilisin-like proprotein convertase family protein
MKKTITPFTKLLVLACLFMGMLSPAQVASTYGFIQSSGTFTSVTGGTVVANNAMGNMDDEIFGPITIPPFTFDGTTYTNIYICTNGFITFGSTAPDYYEYNPISSFSPYNGAVAAFGGDLDVTTLSGAKNIRYVQVGSEFVVQWQNVARYSVTGERLGFQIRLNSATNEIKIVYGSTATIIAGNDQTYAEVGLRGPDNTFGVNVNNREVFDATGAWVNSLPGTSEISTCYFDVATPGTIPVAGTTFLWVAKPDLKISGYTFSGSGNCYGSSEPVNVTLTNTGGNIIDFSVTPVTITSSVSGPNPTSFPPVTINTGTLAVNGTQSVQLSASYDMSAGGGSYVFTTSAPFTGDVHPANNTLVSTVVNARPAVTYANAITCAGQSVSLSGSTSVTPYSISSTNSTAVTIPDDDPAGAFSTITISGAGTTLASDVTATIGSIIHAYSSDMIITLIAPDGSSIDLSDHEGSDADFLNTVFSDQAIDPIYFGDSPFTGTFQPEMPFSGLTGSANGVWKLHIVDDVALDAGVLNSWSLSLPASNGIATYSWSPAATLDTATIASPVASPITTTIYTITVTDERGCTNTDTVQVVANPTPIITATSDAPGNSICTGDSVTLNGNGATSYIWSGSVTDGTAFVPAMTDTYSVTGTDANGCSDTASITVTVNNPPTVTASSSSPTDTVCAGSNLTLNGGGATSYSWTGSVTNGVAFLASSSDTYTVTGTDANGCSDTAMITITVNTLPTITASSDAPTDEICAGDSVTLTGAGAVSYSWSGGVTDGTAFSPVSTNAYIVTGTDTNGCTNTALITITVNTLPSVTASSDAPSDAVCTGGSVTLTGSGATSYAWTGSITDGMPFAPSATDTYTVTGTDNNGCSGTAMITITLNSLPVVDVTFATNAYCVNDAAFALSGESPAGGTWSGTGVSGNMFDPATAGSGTSLITYMYTDANGCSASDTSSIFVNPCIGLKENQAAFDLLVYPNPATETIHLSLTNLINSNVTIVLTDMLGKVMYSMQQEQAGRELSTSIDISPFASGAYLLKIKAGDAMQMLKVVKQ